VIFSVDFIMHTLNYVIWKEDEFFVSQCLNVDVSSFGETREEAVSNLKEAVSLYLQDEDNPEFTPIEFIEAGSAEVYA
jgi:predicted RNase H-like HicB family nuclease